MLPGSIIGFAIAAVTFPYLSERSGRDRMREFSTLLHTSLSLALTIALPTAIFFLVFSKDLIAAVFFRGAFDLNSLKMTSQIVKAYSPYVVCLFLYAIMIQACYSSGRQKTVFWISLLAAAAKLFLTWLFKSIFDYPGIALATSAVHVMIFGLLAAILARQGLLADIKGLAVTVLRVIVASIPILVIGYFSGMLPEISSGTTFLQKMRVIPIAILSLVLFIGMGYIMRINEIMSLLKGLKKEL